MSGSATEHLHRYALASLLTEDKTVLDIACGEGYGSHLMAKKAKYVAGVDLDIITVQTAAKKYLAPNLEFKQGNAAEIPFGDHFFDIVVSFETIEHHDRHDEMMREIKRVLKPSGVCIISTPDKMEYSDKKNFKNPFHVKELYRDEFKSLLLAHFKHLVLLEQRFISGSMLIPEGATDLSMNVFEGDFYDVRGGGKIEAEYLIAFAGDGSVPKGEFSFFLNSDFGENKILEFQESSRRYKLGNNILKPWVYFRKNILGRR
jgi:SAM-dependent methyltransferase